MTRQDVSCRQTTPFTLQVLLGKHITSDPHSIIPFVSLFLSWSWVIVSLSLFRFRAYLFVDKKHVHDVVVDGPELILFSTFRPDRGPQSSLLA